MGYERLLKTVLAPSGLLGRLFGSVYSACRRCNVILGGADPEQQQVAQRFATSNESSSSSRSKQKGGSGDGYSGGNQRAVCEAYCQLFTSFSFFLVKGVLIPSLETATMLLQIFTIPGNLKIWETRNLKI